MAANKTYVTIDVQEDYMSAQLFGELDHHSVQAIREEIDRMALQNRPTELILDFGGVTFMDSSGIGLVLGRTRTMGAVGGRVEIVGASKSIERLFRMGRRL